MSVVRAFLFVLLHHYGVRMVDCGNYLYFLSLDSPTYIHGDDSASVTVYIPGGFPFGGWSQYYLHVSSNGYISLGSSISLHYHRFGTFSSATKHSVVAPFASDIDISAGGSVSYQVHSSGSSSALLRQVSNFIKTSQDVNFLGSWMLIAYWSRVPYYGGPASITNSFQVILITDGHNSFTVFTYVCSSMEWGINATIGWQASSFYFRNHPLSNTGQANLIACLNEPTHSVANVVFQLSSVAPCYDQKFGCFNGECVGSGSEWCNNITECNDNSDEAACPIQCSEDQFQCEHRLFCVDRSALCDYVNNCHDRSDELNCGYEKCTSTELMCSNGRCISSSHNCDGHNDCGDFSDEKDCPTADDGSCELKCNNGVCVVDSKRCDGNDDCGDKTDEDSCSSSQINVGLSIGVPVTLTVLFVVSCPLCILFIASRTKWRRRRRVVSYSVATNPSLHTEETLVNYQRLLNGASESINATGSAAQHEAPPPYPGTGYYEDTEPILGAPPPEYSEDPPLPTCHPPQPSAAEEWHSESYSHP